MRVLRRGPDPQRLADLDRPACIMQRRRGLRNMTQIKGHICGALGMLEL